MYRGTVPVFFMTEMADTHGLPGGSSRVEQAGTASMAVIWVIADAPAGLL